MTAPNIGDGFRPVADQSHADPIQSRGPLLIAPGSVTNGEFGLFEINVSPGDSTPSAHYHTTFSESFYILEGRIDLRLGDSIHTAGPGDFAYVPRSGVHGFTNATTEPARMLILFAPGIAREDYFAELIELYSRPEPPTTAEIDAVARRHDQVNLRPEDNGILQQGNSQD